MNWVDLINISASIGAFVSAVVAVVTLREIKKQRESTYKPELVMRSLNIGISKSPFCLGEDEILEYKVSNFNDYSTNYNEVKNSTFAGYLLNNLGFGIAKKVTCTWIYDHEKAIEELRNVIGEDFRINHHTGSYYLEDLKDDNFFYSANYSFDFGPDFTEYIAPVSVEKNFNFHSVPRVILFTHYLYLIFEFQIHTTVPQQFGVYEFESLPKPRLEIEYFDLNDKKYKKTISFKIVAVASQIGDVINPNEEFCMLQFNVE